MRRVFISPVLFLMELLLLLLILPYTASQLCDLALLPHSVTVRHFRREYSECDLQLDLSFRSETIT